MRPRLIAMLAVVAWLLAELSPVASARAVHVQRPAQHHHTLVPTSPGLRLPARAAAVSSLNWSGYADVAPAGSHITSVTGNWTVPAVQLVPPGFSASWTGIGGYNTQDLIQAGTTQDALPIGGPQYYAWYEILPAAETPISGCTGDANCTVRPGDAVSVTIDSLGGTQWHISMADAGHWTWALTLAYASTESSAEWILEAPSLIAFPTLLANVGTNTFDPGNSFAIDGATKNIAQGNPVSIQLSVLGLLTEASPSPLDSDGDGFNACSYAASCGAPTS
jgi:hypothetical protein